MWEGMVVLKSLREVNEKSSQFLKGQVPSNPNPSTPKSIFNLILESTTWSFGTLWIAD